MSGPGEDPPSCSDGCKKSALHVRVGMTKAGASGTGEISGLLPPGNNQPDTIDVGDAVVPESGTVDNVTPTFAGDPNKVLTNKPGGFDVSTLSIKVEYGASTGHDGSCAADTPPGTGCHEESGCSGSVGCDVTVTGCDVGAGPGVGDLGQKNISYPAFAGAPFGGVPVVLGAASSWPPASSNGANGNTNARSTYVSGMKNKAHVEVQFGPHCGTRQVVLMPLFYPGTTTLIKGQAPNGDLYYLVVELQTECSGC